MTVTRIEELSRSRCKIYLEDSFAFVLYKGELRLFGVREQEELSEESYREIMQEVLPKRATLRCMNLLQSRAYTESMHYPDHLRIITVWLTWQNGFMKS